MAATITELPPDMKCERCGVKLRPATKDELAADLRHPDYRDTALQSARGRRDFRQPEHLIRWGVVSEDDRPSWQLRCDSCGMRAVISRLAPPQDEWSLLRLPRSRWATVRRALRKSPYPACLGSVLRRHERSRGVGRLSSD